MTVRTSAPRQIAGADGDLSRYFELLKRTLYGSVYEESAWRVLDPDERPGSAERMWCRIEPPVGGFGSS